MIEPQATGLEGVNAVGYACLAVFVLSCFAVLFFAHRLKLRGEHYFPRSAWRDPNFRRHFLPFVGFCALGVAAIFVGLLFGGFPHG